LSGRYQPQETIRNIISKIEKREWILPGIQRKFVWDTERILNLFDSLMRGYPIGTLMVWKVSKQETIRKIGFFDFLQDYRERFTEKCNDYKPSTDGAVYSVIDGQQRLNSLYLGLKGSYAVKLPRRKWKNAYDSSIQPKMYLYINLCEHLKNDDSGKFYNFLFMSNSTYENLGIKKHQWFKVSDILDLPSFDESRLDDDDFIEELKKIISNMGINDDLEKKESLKTLKKLYKIIFTSSTINYYLEEDDELDRVVDIFVRTNSGGVPLAFSDLVLSVIVSRWSEAGSKIDEIVNIVRTETSISISRDFILKAFLYLYSEDIRFRVGNIDDNFVDNLKSRLDEVGEHIKSVCIFTKQIGLNDETIRAKYALLPLLYYSIKNNIKLDNLAKYPDNRKSCGKFLKLSLIKGLHGGSPDSTLIPIKKLIDKSNNNFPIKEIANHFVGAPRNLTLTDEDIKSLVDETSWGTYGARLLLSIITNINPEFSYEHIDHLYPKSMFVEKELNSLNFLKDNPQLKAFYSDKKNWNTLGNLQLLNSAENESKNNERLSSWLSKKPEYKSTIIVPKDDNGNDIVNDDQFKEFIISRRKLLCEILKKETTL